MGTGLGTRWLRMCTNHPAVKSKLATGAHRAQGGFGHQEKSWRQNTPLFSGARGGSAGMARPGHPNVLGVGSLLSPWGPGDGHEVRDARGSGTA